MTLDLHTSAAEELTGAPIAFALLWPHLPKAGTAVDRGDRAGLRGFGRHGNGAHHL